MGSAASRVSLREGRTPQSDNRRLTVFLMNFRSLALIARSGLCGICARRDPPAGLVSLHLAGVAAGLTLPSVRLT